MSYAMSQVATKLGISKDTIRYYEIEGLLPPIDRDSSGRRVFSESDVEWIFLIRCLRDTDMPINRIKRYVSLLMAGGGESIPGRRDILKEHEGILLRKIALYQGLLELIRQKLEFYEGVLKANDPEAMRCMDYITEWDSFRSSLGGLLK